MKKILLLILSLIIIVEGCIFSAPVFAQELSLPEPSNVIINVCSETAVLSWRNPAYDNAIALSKITLYDGWGEILSDSFSTESNAANMYKAENLSNGEIYSYTLEFIYENGEKRSIILAAKPEETSDLLPELTDENGYYIYSDSAIYEDVAGILFDSDVYCSEKDIKNQASSASIKFFGNNPEGTEKSYATLTAKEALYADLEYTISFWVKSENGGGGRVRFNGLEDNDIVIPAGDMEWTKFEKTVGPIDSTSWDLMDASLEFIMNTNSGGIWIDNIEMFEDGSDYDALNRVSGNNMSANNSSFSPEEMVKKGTSSFANAVTAEAFSYSSMGEIEFEWDENYSGDADLKNTVSEIKVFETTNDEEKLVAIMPFGMNWLVFENLTNGNTYSYRYEICCGKSKSVIAKNSTEITLSPTAEDYTKYEPQSVLIKGEDMKITISWINPQETDGNIRTLRKICLYKINDDETETLLSDDFSLSGGMSGIYIDSELPNNKMYSYKLSFLYDNARPLDLYLAEKTTTAKKPFGTGKYPWQFGTQIGGSEFTVDKEVFCGEESTASIRFVANTDVRVDSADVAYIPYHSVKFEEGKRYHMELDIKGENAAGGRFLIGGWENTYTLPSNTFDWTHVSKDWLYAKSSSNFYFRPTLVSGAKYWLDNLKIYEIDADGNQIGDDMAELYSAESIDIDSYPQPIEVEATEDNITVNWEATASLDMMRIYVQDETGTFLRAIAPASAESTKLGGVGFGEYTVIAKSVVSSMESKNFETASLRPVAKNVETSGYIIKNSNGDDVYSITDTGEYSVKIDVKNNYKGDNFTAQLIVAQYDENDDMIAVDGSSAIKIFETDPEDYSPVSLMSDINVSDYTRKITVYLWNSIDGMDEIIESRALK